MAMRQLQLACWYLTVLLAVAVMPLPAWAESVADTYRLYCSQCHGTKGNGRGINETAGGLAVSPRDHTDAAAMSKLSDHELRLAIAEGGDAVQKSELMPPWGQTLSAQQIDDLVRHLRALCKCKGGQ
jgi:cytochrome c oxidase cbb3-type subunit 3